MDNEFKILAKPATLKFPGEDHSERFYGKWFEIPFILLLAPKIVFLLQSFINNQKSEQQHNKGEVPPYTRQFIQQVGETIVIYPSKRIDKRKIGISIEIRNWIRVVCKIDEIFLEK